MATEFPFLVTLEGSCDEYCKTLEEAEELAHSLMEDMREGAAMNGEWSDDTRIQIFRLVKTYDVVPVDGEFSDYEEIKTQDAPTTKTL